MAFAREIEPQVRLALQKFPVVGITGPRQSGKTTLCKMLAPDYTYVNLEDLSVRNFAQTDPKGFLETYQNGAILDEIQYVPELFSYLQVYTDARGRKGEYLITGSQHFLLLEKIAQSLAGRVSLFHLLPFSVSELRTHHVTFPDWEVYAMRGGYPRIWVEDIPPFLYYESYVKTYVERDVRLIKNIADLALFQKFLFLLAGRVGQLFNQSSLATELGIDNKTVQSWMTLLEASFIAFRLQPYHRNFSKQVVKTPKVFFYDTGLLCFLLGIRNREEMQIHFAKGQVFENLVVLEFIKKNLHRGLYEKPFFWRDRHGNEVDLLMERGSELMAIEIKSARTLHPDFFRALVHFKKLHPVARPFLVYGGNEKQSRSEATVLGIEHIQEL